MPSHLLGPANFWMSPPSHRGPCRNLPGPDLQKECLSPDEKVGGSQRYLERWALTQGPMTPSVIGQLQEFP